MAILFAAGRFKATDKANVPIPGAFLAFYATQTSTFQPIYADSALSATLTNPVKADANGLFPEIWLDDSLPPYKVIHSSPDTTNPTQPGSIIWTIPLYNAAIEPNSLGQVLYAQTPAEQSAAVTPTNPVYEPLDPRRYATTAQWSAVYAQISNLVASYVGWYRGDHAQHPSLTNAIVGYQTYDDAQQIGTVGYRCAAFGAFALQQNKNSTTAGGSNSAFGFGVLQANIEGSGNTAMGALALNALSGSPGTDSNHHNNAFGYRVFAACINGIQNNGFGFQVGNSLLTGNNNHGFGESTLYTLTNGNGNVCYGYQACYAKAVGDFTHAFGYDALFSEASLNVSGISQASSAVITLSTVSTINPLSIGCPVQLYNVVGMTQINGVIGSVTAIGGSSGAWTATVTINSSGFSAYTAGGQLSPIGNSAFGYQSGFQVAARGANTLMGYQVASSAEPGAANSIYGYQAGQALNCNAGAGSADYNCIFGFQAALRMTGGNQSAIYGAQAGNNITSGSGHSIVGSNAGQGVTTANNNVWMGEISGVNLNGNNNTGVGYNAGSQGSAQTYSNTSSLGANAVPTGSNQVTLGDSGVATLRCQQTTITALSDERFKTDIELLDIPDGFLNEVRIVTYKWILEGMPQGKQVGVIAQQLDVLQEQYGLKWLGLVDKSNPDRWEATPGKLLFPLIQRVQRQDAQLKRFESRLERLERALKY